MNKGVYNGTLLKEYREKKQFGLFIDNAAVNTSYFQQFNGYVIEICTH